MHILTTLWGKGIKQTWGKGIKKNSLLLSAKSIK